MDYGIRSRGEDGFINLHSSYSSLVYAGEMSVSAAAVRPVYQGDYAALIPENTKYNSYDQGWIVQFTVVLTGVSTMMPFYAPHYGGQEIAIMDVINEGSTWVVNLLHSGGSADTPKVFCFAPLTERSVTQNQYGLTVFDDSNKIRFTTSQKPLRLDDVITITHPSAIKTGARGTCANSAACHIDYSPDQQNTFTGTTLNTPSKIYHIVPSAYGGLAYQNDGTFERSCGFLNWGDRPYAWAYQSWASFRGTIAHPIDSSTHKAGYLGDFAGVLHQEVRGSCGYGGFLGALIGIIAVVLTGGAALALVGGALAGFTVASMTGSAAPSIKAYDVDATFDTANTGNLLVTDASYYGLEAGTSGGPTGGPTGGIPGQAFYFNTTGSYTTHFFWLMVYSDGLLTGIMTNYSGALGNPVPVSQDTTSMFAHPLVIYKGAYQETYTGTGSNGEEEVYDYYSVGGYNVMTEIPPY